MKIRPASAHEHGTIRALLSASGLPTADLADGDVQFLVAHDDHDIVGAVALQTFGRSGLLRSLVVDPAARGAGVGTDLVHAVERDARARGVEQLVLLTQTVAPLFARHGYAVIDRADAPAAVQGSAEFTALCPASATCMTKALEVLHDA